ncbi:hypothetical protein NBRC111894_1421 [Sporolactobacillus inulinus]|uniref:Uncharacterized protein n=1 Tax=Sporolactobacillus inulinus TaxID=2078 RepID=A0A4Y1Z9Y9_9BACL|nr:hypothetical protein NBRC111894_1421 [Sporolactobacillus inulinus]
MKDKKKPCFQMEAGRSISFYVQLLVRMSKIGPVLSGF